VYYNDFTQALITFLAFLYFAMLRNRKGKSYKTGSLHEICNTTLKPIAGPSGSHGFRRSTTFIRGTKKLEEHRIQVEDRVQTIMTGEHDQGKILN
jgi:hypothetical protein